MCVVSFIIWIVVHKGIWHRSFPFFKILVPELANYPYLLLSCFLFFIMQKKKKIRKKKAYVHLLNWGAEFWRILNELLKWKRYNPANKCWVLCRYVLTTISVYLPWEMMSVRKTLCCSLHNKWSKNRYKSWTCHLPFGLSPSPLFEYMRN